MERIEALINKLNEQSAQHADPAQLLVTVQLLHYELSLIQGERGKSLGTAKVSVVLPGSMNPSYNIPQQYEKYLPKTVVEVEKPLLEEVKETVLIDNGSLSVVQKNGQLDMVFDPMKEIPTLSHQLHNREINDATTLGESLNDKLKQGKTELVEILKESPVKDLRKAVGINDRFLFINDLFRGDEAMYERSIKTINSFNIYPEAEYWIIRELKVKLGWDNNHTTVQHFDQLVKRRFS
jgi:hypothetical protein